MSYDSRYDCPQTYLKPYWGFYEFAAAVLELCENPSWQQAWRSKVHFNDVQLWIFKWVVAWINFEIVIFICHYYILYLQKKKSARVMYKYLLSKRIKWFGTNLTPLAICWLFVIHSSVLPVKGFDYPLYPNEAIFSPKRILTNRMSFVRRERRPSRTVFNTTFSSRTNSSLKFSHRKV